MLDRLPNLLYGQCIFQIEAGIPNIPIYIREANHEKIRRHAEATGKSMGKIINELIRRKMD